MLLPLLLVLPGCAQTTCPALPAHTHRQAVEEGTIKHLHLAIVVASSKH
jgi:hypothetical protein